MAVIDKNGRSKTLKTSPKVNRNRKFFTHSQGYEIMNDENTMVRNSGNEDLMPVSP